jgi:hypothetical protein
MANNNEIDLNNLRTLGIYKPTLTNLYDEKNRKAVSPEEAEQVNVDDIKSKKNAAEIKKFDDNARLIDLYDENEQRTKSPLEISKNEDGTTTLVPIEGEEKTFNDLKNRSFELREDRFLYNPSSKIQENILYKQDAMNTSDKTEVLDMVGAELSSQFPGQSKKAIDLKSGEKALLASVTLDDIENRKRNLSSEMNIFLYNLLPYVGTGVAKTIMNAVSNGQKIGTNPIALANMAGTILNAATTISYLSAEELVLLFGSNFYTMYFVRGVSVKKKAMSVASIKLEPGTDITFGEPTNPTWAASFQDFIKKQVNNLAKQLLGIKETKINPNEEIQTLKPQKSPEIEFYDGGFSIKSINSEKPVLDPSNVKWEKRTPNLIDYPAVLTPENMINSRRNPKKRVLKAALKEKAFFKKFGVYQVGAIYVMPIFDVDNKDGSKNFFIPFEFNPQIDEGSVATKYQAQEFLARIGQTQSFSNVDSLTVNITTRYWAISDGSEPPEEAAWMKDFTISNIQMIENMYRSLGLPSYPKSEDQIDNGFKYIKPPVIKVIFGNTDRINPFSGLLTYAIENDISKDKRQSEQTLAKGAYIKNKTFVVTSVGVRKDMIETPLYLDSDLFVTDTFGFEVSLSLVEVTPSYMDQPIDFKTYYNQFTTTVPEGFIKS